MHNINNSLETTLVKIGVKLEDYFHSDTEESDHLELLDVKVEENLQMIIKKEEYQESQSSQPYSMPFPKEHNKSIALTRSKPLPGVKNVVKNYGKAMCSFAYSDIAEPYLKPLLAKEGVTREGFIEWVQNNKERVDGIERLRWLLLASPQDEEIVRNYKRVFQKICEVFLKYFCVNWIYNGKLTHRETHLSVMFKMLRRIQKPELFTYLYSVRKKKV